MHNSSVNDVLERLCHGDPAAAEQAFLEYEPYLRQVVRRLLPPRLRAKFDSADIVQSAWSDLLRGFRDAGWRFTEPAQLRAFLARAARNRFIDRYRQQDRFARQEAPFTENALDRLPADNTPAPSAEVRAEELWQRLQALCPPEHLPILQMKQQGLSLDEIMARTGLHPGSIRRILRNLACQAAEEVPPSSP